MNYTKKVMMRKEKISKSTNEGPVCLRITINRKSGYMTIFNMKTELWDDNKNQVKKNHPNAADMNANISQIVANFEALMLRLDATKQVISVSDVRNMLQNKNEKYIDLFQYADTFNLQVYNKGHYKTYKSYNCIINKLRNYTGTKELPINRIDLNFIKKYESYLSQTLKNKPTTIAKEMKTLKRYINDIYETNNLENANNPFRKYKIKRGGYTPRVFLEKDELKKIENLKLKLQHPLYDARELYLFECYTGLRISDILMLKWKNVLENCLRGIAKKTKKTYEIPIIDKTREILERKKNNLIRNENPIKPDKYVFNKLTVDCDLCDNETLERNIESKTVIINKQLKKVAKMAGIEKNLSTHIGRHTFASSLIEQGVDIYVVKELLSHTDVRTTQEYAKMTDSKKYSAMNLLNNV